MRFRGPVQRGSAESLKKHIENSRGLHIRQATGSWDRPTESAAECAADITSGQVVLEKHIGQALVVQRSNRNAPPKVNLSIELEVEMSPTAANLQ